MMVVKILFITERTGIMSKKEKCLRSLIDASRLHERSVIEECFKDCATYHLLTVPETEEGLNLVKRLFSNDIENESLLYDVLNKRCSENVSTAFIHALRELDTEIPFEFKKCKSIYEVREKMLEFGFSSEDRIFDDKIEFSFKSYSYSAKYCLPLHLFTTKSVAKLAKLTLKNSNSVNYFVRSLL